MPAPRYRDGQTVCIEPNSAPDAPYAPPGPYTVLRTLPADDFGRWFYRIASRVDGHERVVGERYLVAVRPAAVVDQPARNPESPAFPAWGAAPA